MDVPLTSLNWSLIQSFLAVAETGSLSAAARKLGASQPTLGRQIKQVEDQLGVTLFHRQPRGFTLTDIGTELLAPAQAMRDAASQVSLVAAGREQGIKGTVRITASIFVSHFILPPIIAKMCPLRGSIATSATCTRHFALIKESTKVLFAIISARVCFRKRLGGTSLINSFSLCIFLLTTA